MKNIRILWIGTRYAYNEFIRRSNGTIEYYFFSSNQQIGIANKICFDGYIKDPSCRFLHMTLDVDDVVKILDERLRKLDNRHSHH